MKVLVLDILGFGRGVATWGKTLTAAFRLAGIEADRITNTDAQKPAVSNSEAVHSLVALCNLYDVVILEEVIRNSKYSQVPELPVYVRALQQTRAKWTTYMHCMSYEVTGVEELFGAPSFSGVLFSPVEEAEDYIPVPKRVVMMPYLPQFVAPRFANHSGSEIACTSVTSGAIKGARPTGLLGKYGLKVILWGSYLQHPGGTTSGGIYKWLVEKHDFKETSREERSPVSGGHWVVSHPSGGEVSFRGGPHGSYYEDLSTVFQQAAAHVSLTSEAWCSGKLEYTTLEAMAYGVPAIVPRCQDPQDRVPVAKIDYVDQRHFNEVELAGTAERLVRLNPRARYSLCKKGRDWLKEHHDPVAYVKKMLAELS